MDMNPVLILTLSVMTWHIVIGQGRVQRCERAPDWWVEGRNPIYEHAAGGNIVVLSILSSTSRKFLRYTLEALDNYGKYYT